jgi:hypothetical protein
MRRFAILALTATSLAFAQTSPGASSGGWRRVTDAAPAPQTAASDPEPVDRSDAYGQPIASGSVVRSTPDGGEAAAPAANERTAYAVPSQLTLKSGVYITVRLNEGLSTDKNQQGDPFSATLEQPIVVDGVVVAQRGQTVYGRVAGVEKQKADRPSRMALQLTSLTLVDGTQTPITSQLIGRQGGQTPAGVQAGTVATTTAVGAGIGAIAGWGTGAAIGAGAGAAAGLVGVLLTRNHPTILYPETVLTFQITSPITISTVRAPQAFRFVGPEDYNHVQTAQLRRPAARPCSACAPLPYVVPYPAWYAPYPYAYAYPYWGPGFGIVIGRSYRWGFHRWR